MAEIIKVEPILQQHRRKRVAAYARVSQASEGLERSLVSQIDYYNKFITGHPEWEYAGTFYDNGISGTDMKNRTGLQKLLHECVQGKVDIILTKSISRFARNTVDLLRTIRHLKDLGISVRFDKENIDTMTSDGELMLTLLAAFAQNESQSISTNVCWSIRNKFKEGHPHRTILYGYRWKKTHFEIEPEEAKVVRWIFNTYMSGLGATSISKALGGKFSDVGILDILKNEKYTGNMMLQKYFVEDSMTHKECLNKGELPRYWIEDSHEAIIPMELFTRVQDEIARRRQLGVFACWHLHTSCFTRRVYCGKCGGMMERVTYKYQGRRYHRWICHKRRVESLDACDMESVPEPALLEALDMDERTIVERVERIVCERERKLIIFYRDGSKEQRKWAWQKPCHHWTAEDKAKASKRHSMTDNPKRNRYAFTRKLRCGCCGKNLSHEKHICFDGFDNTRWRCVNKECDNRTVVIESDMERQMAALLGDAEFDREHFRAAVTYVEISSAAMLRARVVLANGEKREIEWNCPEPHGVGQHRKEDKK